ncbi:MAG: 2-isopropylmalate synthase, partial [Gammaproteobacteria bacterium]|nr:2-isopropylmalate synthase [Gammaproteobacteria bacterium]
MKTNTQGFTHHKYRAFKAIPLADRRWPDTLITKAPRWCAVDLRDGNQALIDPMSPQQKTVLFELLVSMGFKEIEVGFPAASQTDFDFVRQLIENHKIPPDVCIQVLTQARAPLIERTFEALKGVKQANVHLYNSTSPLQREQVFQLDKASIIEIATQGATQVKEQARQAPETEWTFQYSPESFTATELEFSVAICDAVSEIWQPTVDKPIIFNLPATVEVASPNVYADQIEWFCRHIKERECIIISLHTHNDRGCAVAAAELGLMAGAQRVEGTLLGNGERTGNMDIITMAMNFYSQGIDPELDISNIDRIVQTIKSCTNLPVHPRHPYAGELVFTAFSGSHQDAIKKCLANYQPGKPWNAAYLPIDPRDLGRNYQEVIRINSQSGKGGIAYILEAQLGFILPRWLQIEFSAIVQKQTEQQATEISTKDIVRLFKTKYFNTQQLRLGDFQINREKTKSETIERISAELINQDQTLMIDGLGNGALDAFIHGINQAFNINAEITNFSEHALDKGSEASAVSYLQIKCNDQFYYGVATSADVVS